MNPVSPEGPWSLGTLIAFPLGILCILACLAFVAFCLFERFRNGDKDATLLAWGGVIVALLCIGFTAFGMWPFDSEYHQWRTVSGPVDEVSKRLIADGKSMSERYVVVIGGQPFGIDDTRASLIKQGDVVSLSCKKEWQYAAESGWGCRWNGAAS